MKRILLAIISCGFNKKSAAFFVVMMLCFCNNALAATYYSKATGTANDTATWGQNTDGTGTAPTNFTTSGDLFILRSASVLSMSNLLFGGTWIIGSGVTLQVDGTLQLSAAVLATTRVTINSGGTVIFTNIFSTQVTTTALLGVNDFEVASGATLKTANKNGIVGLNCSLSVGTLNNSATYEFNGVSPQATLGLPSSITALKINNAAGVTLSSAVTLSTLTIGDVTSNSVFNDGGRQVSSTGTLNLTSGTFKLGAGTATIFPDFTTRNIFSGTTVEYASGVDQTVSVIPAYQNLVFSGAGNKTIAPGTLSIAGNWTVGSTTAGNTNNPTINLTGNFILNSGTFTSTFWIFSVGGTWLNNSTFTHNSGTVALNGTSQQSVGGSSSTTFNNLIISNAAGALLATNQTVNYLLGLTGGNLDISNKILTMGATAPAISGPFSASRMIIADGGGEIRKSATSNAEASYFFPIGDSTSSNNGAEYTPIALSVTGTGYSSAYVGVSLSDTKQNNNASTTNYLTRYWNVKQSGISSCLATVVGTYSNSTSDVSGTLGSIKAAQLNGVFNQISNPWVKTGGSTLSGTTLTYTNAAITAGQASVFTGISDLTVSITGGNIAACYGVNVSLGTSIIGDATTYVWSPATFLSSTTISNPVVTAPTATTSYTVTVVDGNGIVATSAISTLTIVVSTWNGSSWDNVPTATNSLVINGTYNSTSDLSGCSCTINSGDVVINSGHTLTVTNGLTVSGGSLTFEDDASLVQINDVANTGDITYKRETTPITNLDFTYWSSPVSPQTLYNVSPGTFWDKFLSFDSNINNWKPENSMNLMKKGVGYIIRGPQDHAVQSPPVPPSPYIASFIGVPHNGSFSLTGIGAGKWYLIGNPYPSALDADAFLAANNGVLEGTIYFWTHNTAIQLASGIDPEKAGTGIYAYTSDDYAAYNGVGGVNTGPAEGDIKVPSGKIATGQSFFGASKANPTDDEIVFNNIMRVGGEGIAGNNSQFFRMNTSSKTDAIERHRVWLNLTNAQGAFKQTLVGYVSSATNGYDGAFDGESFGGNKFVDFYSVNQDRNLTIQGRVLPFDETDVVPLGYKTTIEGTFSISIDHVDGLLASQTVFLEDKDANVIKNLKEGAYSFFTNMGSFNDRFVLKYTNKTLAANDFQVQENSVLVSSKNKEIKIDSSIETIDKVQVYDLLGKQIYQKINVNGTEFSISNLGITKQVLIVKVVLQNGKTVANKVVLK